MTRDTDVQRFRKLADDKKTWIPDTALDAADVCRVEICFLACAFLGEAAGLSMPAHIQTECAQRSWQIRLHPGASPGLGRSVYGR